MFDSIINYMDKFGPEILVIQFGFLVIISTIFLWLWFSNRRKYHNLKHAIPANVVKSYLDSIIQNSTSLKSQLFRGGGLDVSNVPSVIPLQNLTGGEGVALSGAPSTALLEELNQKKAQIAAMEGQLSSLQNARPELEAKLGQSQNNLSSAEQKIKELESLLAQNRSGAGGDETLKSELDMVSKERNELRDRLKEFEIIADDLANLKRLQQENEQLKRSLAAQGAEQSIAEVDEDIGPVNHAEVSDLLEDLGQADTSSSGDNSALEEFLSTSEGSPEVEAELEAPVETAAQAEVETQIEEPVAEGETEAAVAQEGDEDNKSKSEKTPEDLLSEFEKMLG